MQDKITKIIDRIDYECYDNWDCSSSDINKIKKILEEELLKEETKPPFELEEMVSKYPRWNWVFDLSYNTNCIVNNIKEIYDHLFPKK